MERDEENEILREDFLKTLKEIKSLYKDNKLVLSDVVLEKLTLYLHPSNILKVAG